MTADLQRFKELIAKAATGKPLDEAEATDAFGLMMTGNATPAQIAGLLMALRVRGETVEEITAGARSLRERMARISAPEGAIDTCGTPHECPAGIARAVHSCGAGSENQFGKDE